LIEKEKILLNKIYQGDCLDIMKQIDQMVDLTFLDPPFNQNKDYQYFNDNLTDAEYWGMMEKVCQNIYEVTNHGGSVYFMQREKNTENVLKVLRETGWILQNLIIWKKKTSAVPCANKYGKHYQIIAYAIKGDKPKCFNKLRIDIPLPANYKQSYDNGVFVTDVWDDIRELTSGYYAGDEAIRDGKGVRFHKQQSPIALLLRIILSSSMPNDLVFDPFTGTGTSLVVAKQLDRKFLGIEIDPNNVKCIENRLASIQKSDSINKFFKYYKYTDNINAIWQSDINNAVELNHKQTESTLFA